MKLVLRKNLVLQKWHSRNLKRHVFDTKFHIMTQLFASRERKFENQSLLVNIINTERILFNRFHRQKRRIRNNDAAILNT